MQDSSKESKDPKIRILEVDRKLAAQLYDVWQDMKLRIQKDEQPTKTHTAASSPLAPSDPSSIACARNHF